MSKKFQKFIKQGFRQALENVPFHKKAPVDRFMMVDHNAIPESGAYIAVHQISDLPNKIPNYCEMHKHPYDEINLILSQNGELKYRIKMEDEVYEVSSPATVYIPKGTRHSAEVISGQGTYICIILSGKYHVEG